MNEANKLITTFLEKCRSQSAKPLLVILGPTASGKTALSLKAAKEFYGEIISADSRQVYKYMNIGTDKIPEELREGVPHFLLDVAEPTQRFTVADFKKLAEEHIEEILSRGRLPMLVGGTGLYIRAITENYDFPPENKEIRAMLMKELAENGPVEGPKKLHEKLAQVDPASAAKISPNNAPYIIRALEIFHATGRPKNDQRTKSPYEILQIGLNPTREVLFERIHQRVDAQLKKGLLEETKHLLEMGYPKNLSAMRTLGYEEMIEHIEGKITLEAATELIKKNTRNFAKRQMTWFKKDRGVVWIS